MPAEAPTELESLRVAAAAGVAPLITVERRNVQAKPTRVGYAERRITIRISP
jgi:hypothetical protein